MTENSRPKDIAVKASMCIGAVVVAYHINRYLIAEKTESFLAQEEQQLEKELAKCKERFTGNIAEQGYSSSKKWCDMSLKDGKIDQEGYKSCLAQERRLEFENCWKDAYQKSIDRMKQYMKQRKYKK